MQIGDGEGQGKMRCLHAALISPSAPDTTPVGGARDKVLGRGWDGGRQADDGVKGDARYGPVSLACWPSSRASDAVRSLTGSSAAAIRQIIGASKAEMWDASNFSNRRRHPVCTADPPTAAPCRVWTSWLLFCARSSTPARSGIHIQLYTTLLDLQLGGHHSSQRSCCCCMSSFTAGFLHSGLRCSLRGADLNRYAQAFARIAGMANVS